MRRFRHSQSVDEPSGTAARDDGVVISFDRARCPYGCLDQYCCPASGDVECPRHRGFDVSCDALSGTSQLPYSGSTYQAHRSASPSSPDTLPITSSEHVRHPCLWVIRCHTNPDGAQAPRGQPPIPSTRSAQETRPRRRSLSRARSSPENRRYPGPPPKVTVRDHHPSPGGPTSHTSRQTGGLQPTRRMMR